MAKHDVLVVIPTLRAGEPLRATIEGLAAQSWKDFEVIVVDNSGQRLSADFSADPRLTLRMLYMENNVGYGGAINRAINHSEARLIAVLNDDAVPQEEWLGALVKAADTYPEYGMFSCQIRLAGTDLLDSTALMMSRDGSSVQRSHRKLWQDDRSPASALLPSGCAALYRRKALQDSGHFDVDFFLYGEDTDVGLRMLWQNWPCLYVRDAIVEHAYSATAGTASALKAYLVERNRLFLVVKNFPFSDAVAAFVFAPYRYLCHLVAMFSGRGKAAEFSRGASGLLLPWLVLKAHLVLLVSLPHLLRYRRGIRKHARVSKEQFRKMIYAHRVSLWKVAKH